MSQFLSWLISKSRTQGTEKSVNPAEKKSTEPSGKPPPPPDEVRVDVPLFEVQFGGGEEGKDYIPVLGPTKDRREVTSEFGLRPGPFGGPPEDHKGVDLRAREPVELIPPESGEVVTAGWKDDGAGRRVVILHCMKDTGRPYDFYSVYQHMSRIDVVVGQRVTRETVLGLSGGDPADPQAGRSQAPHIHLGVATYPVFKYVRPVLHWPRPPDAVRISVV